MPFLWQIYLITLYQKSPWEDIDKITFLIPNSKTRQKNIILYNKKSSKVHQKQVYLPK